MFKCGIIIEFWPIQIHNIWTGNYPHHLKKGVSLKQ